VQVGRRETPAEDAAVIEKIREVVGYKINIRADANRKWTYEQAIEFGSRVKRFCLQYIEVIYLLFICNFVVLCNSLIDKHKTCLPSSAPCYYNATCS
jgi:hypothetical protein